MAGRIVGEVTGDRLSRNGDEVPDAGQFRLTYPGDEEKVLHSLKWPVLVAKRNNSLSEHRSDPGELLQLCRVSAVEGDRSAVATGGFGVQTVGSGNVDLLPRCHNTRQVEPLEASARGRSAGGRYGVCNQRTIIQCHETG